jgi:tRNA(Ile)-lysidine synthase
MSADTLLDESVLERLREPKWSRLVVALSGGVDSVVLLHALVRAGCPGSICAVHINHQLQAAADEFISCCQRVCEQLDVPLKQIEVDVASHGSVEARAREARYEAFESYLQPGDLLLLAHHADDQVETVLFRLLREGRLEGMPGMRAVGEAMLFRPLLSCSRSDILAYAGKNDLAWAEDPSNLSLEHDRNFLRHEVLPRLERRWPSARQTLISAAQAERSLQDRLQAQRVDRLAGIRPCPDCLVLETMRELAEREVADLLLAWLIGLELPLPARRMLDQMAASIRNRQHIDMQTSHLAFRERAGCLYVMKALAEPVAEDIALAAGSYPFSCGEVINNPNESTKGKGLRPGAYRLRTRCGGETLRIRHRRSLKQLFQETGVPVWLRSRVPVIWDGDQPVAVAALPEWGLPMLIADGYEAGPGESWQVDFRAGDRVC